MGQKAYESLGIRDWVECYKMCLLDLAWPWLLQTWAYVSCGDLRKTWFLKYSGMDGGKSRDHPSRELEAADGC